MTSDPRKLSPEICRPWFELQSKEGAKLVPEPTADDPYEDEAYRLWAIKQRSK